MIINKVNIDKWLFDYFEGNLSTHEKMEIERFIEANPEYEMDLDAWEDSYDMTQEVPVYSIPNQLYKESFLVTNKYLVASVLFLMFSLSGVLFYNWNNTNLKKEALSNFDNGLTVEQNESKSFEKKAVNKEKNRSENSKVAEGNRIQIVTQNNEGSEKEKGSDFESIFIKENKNKKTSNLVNQKEVKKSREHKNSRQNKDKAPKRTLKIKNNRAKSHKKKISTNSLVNAITESKVNKATELNKNSKTNSNKKQRIIYRTEKRNIKVLKSRESDKKLVKYYKEFKKEDLNKKYNYLDYNRKRKSEANYATNQKIEREREKLEKDKEKQGRKLIYFDNVALIGVLFDNKGKVNNKKKKSFINKLKQKELALVNTHDPIFVTNISNPMANNIALTGGLEMTRFKVNTIDRWNKTLNNRVGGVFSADTYLSKIKAGVGLIVESKNYTNIGIYSTNYGLIYSQRLELSENKSISLGAKFNHAITKFKTEKLKDLDGNLEVELDQNNSFSVSNYHQELPLNKQNNLSFGAWYDGGYFYGGISVDNIKTIKSENNNANQFVEYINPVKFAVQLGTDYRKNAYSALIISPQLSYRYQQNRSEVWLASTLKYKNFLTGIGASTGKSFKINIGAQGDKMRLIYGFNYAKSIAEEKFYGTHEISFRYILRSKNSCKKK